MNEMERSELKHELKVALIDALNLEMRPEEIADDQPLFGEGLGLDSIDALEIMLILERQYAIKLKNAAEAKKVFRSIDSLADYVLANKRNNNSLQKDE